MSQKRRRRGESGLAVLQVLQRGQITIPKGLRDQVGAETGTRLLAYVEGTRIILEVLPQSRSILDLAGILPHRGPVDLERARREAQAERSRRWLEKSGRLSGWSVAESSGPSEPEEPAPEA